MGAWGTAPWDNDAAADWYGEVLRRTGFARAVEETLRLDVTDHHEEVRAAAAVLVLLGRVYAWPHDTLDRHLALAIEKLRAVRALPEYRENAEFASAIDNEIAALRSRLPEGEGTRARPSEKWWLTWL